MSKCRAEAESRDRHRRSAIHAAARQAPCRAQSAVELAAPTVDRAAMETLRAEQLHGRSGTGITQALADASARPAGQLRQLDKRMERRWS
jgi:hypothetical protein